MTLLLAATVVQGACLLKSVSRFSALICVSSALLNEQTDFAGSCKSDVALVLYLNHKSGGIELFFSIQTRDATF